MGLRLLLPAAHSKADSRKGDLSSQLASAIGIAVFGQSREAQHHVTTRATTEKAEAECRDE